MSLADFSTLRSPSTPALSENSPSPSPAPSSSLRDATVADAESTRNGKDSISEIKRRAECPVCFYEFHDVPKRLMPLALQCGHLVCGGCVRKLSNHTAGGANQRPSGHISCPVCRTVVPATNLPAIKEIAYFARQHVFAEIEIKQLRKTIAKLDKKSNRNRVQKLVRDVNTERKKRLGMIKELQMSLKKMKESATIFEVHCETDASDDIVEQRRLRLEGKKKAEDEVNEELARMTDQVKRVAEMLEKDPVLA